MRLLYPRLNYSMSVFGFFSGLLGLFRNRYKSKILENYDIKNGVNAFFFNHARSGLSFFLRQHPHIKRVGVQPYTCPTVIEAIVTSGATVVFIDINETLCLDINSLKRHKDEFDALIVTHTFGRNADVNVIRDIVGDKVIIEDCAHAFLSANDTDIIGKNGDIAIFSFGFAKFPSAVNGGYVLVNNQSLLDQFNKHYQEISAYNFLSEAVNVIMSLVKVLLHIPFVYSVVTVKMKDKKRTIPYAESKVIIKKTHRFSMGVFLSELQTIIGNLALQQENGRRLIKAVEGNTSLYSIVPTKGMNCFMIPIILDQPLDFIGYAIAHGLEIGRHFYISKQVVFLHGYQLGRCPNYERMIEQIVTLPSHYNYSSKKIDQLCRFIESYKPS
jgi:perosamine synthetase